MVAQARGVLGSTPSNWRPFHFPCIFTLWHLLNVMVLVNYNVLTCTEWDKAISLSVCLSVSLLVNNEMNEIIVI